jgi:hypothetical protein
MGWMSGGGPMTNRFELVAAAVDWPTVDRSVVASWRNRREAETSGPLSANWARR